MTEKNEFNREHKVTLADVHHAFLDYSMRNDLSRMEFLFLDDVWANVKQYLLYEFGGF